MLLIVTRRPSDPMEIVSVLGEDDFPLPIREDEIIRPSPELKLGNDHYVIDTKDDWLLWVEEYGHHQTPPILWWSV